MEVILDCLKDNWLMFPLLYVAFCVLEVFERKYNEVDDRVFFALQKFGPLIGAAVGLIPQCGFAILAVMLFLQKNITIGTLIAVIVATSDEAIPIMISNPSMYGQLIMLLALKFVIGTIAGYFVDKVLFPHQKILEFEEEDEEEQQEEVEEEQDQQSNEVSCPCCMPQYPIYISALIRAAKIFGFIMVTSIVISLLIEWIGEEALQKLLLRDSIFQPCIAAVLGFIPNCAITAVLAQLYMLNTLSFGSLLSGLITNAGLTLVCLFQYDGNRKEVAQIVVIAYVVAIMSGLLINFLF